jgi:hypothetical protein
MRHFAEQKRFPGRSGMKRFSQSDDAQMSLASFDLAFMGATVGAYLKDVKENRMRLLARLWRVLHNFSTKPQPKLGLGGSGNFYLLLSP